MLTYSVVVHSVLLVEIEVFDLVKVLVNMAKTKTDYSEVHAPGNVALYLPNYLFEVFNYLQVLVTMVLKD